MKVEWLLKIVDVRLNTVVLHEDEAQALVTFLAQGLPRQKPQSRSPGRRKGGQARAAKLSPETRTAIAKKAAIARWDQKRGSNGTTDR